MNHALYVSDLDGTLLHSNAELSERTAATINRLIDRGMLFSYASARSFTSAYPVTKSLHLTLPVATYNGAFLVNPANGDVIESCVLDRHEIMPILQVVRSSNIYPLVYALINGQEKVSWVQGKENEGTSKFLAERKGDKRLHPVMSYEQLFEGDIFCLLSIGTQNEVYSYEHITKNNNHIYYHIQEDTYIQGEFFMEIYRHDATKEQAVLKIKQYAQANELVCFGDNVNDIPMFRVADKGFAVSNAKDELKQVATGIIQSNDEDGVALWLEQQFMK